MPEPERLFELEAVRRHYAQLAPTYDARANVACARAYADLVRRAFAGCRRVLEIGAGSGSLLGGVAAPLRVACDLTAAMLARQGGAVAWHRVAGDAQSLPFGADAFDGVFSINLLEHVPEPRRALTEAARVLAPRGRCLAVTPNGDAQGLLDFAERLRLKIPEGPHRFLRSAELAQLGGAAFHVVEHRRFLALPVGPQAFVQLVDRIVGGTGGRGLFQYVLLEKGAASGAGG